MDTATFSVPLLHETREAIDLGNALNSVKGVAHIEMDLDAHSVVVSYDAAFTNRKTLQGAIRNSGYPVAEDRADREEETSS